MEQVSIKKVSNLKNKKFDFVLGEHDFIRSWSNEYYIYIFFFIFSVPADQALKRVKGKYKTGKYKTGKYITF